MMCIIIISILKVKKLGLREVKQLAQVERVQISSGIFSHYEIRESLIIFFLASFRIWRTLIWIWKHQEGLSLVLYILIQVEAI